MINKLSQQLNDQDVTVETHPITAAAILNLLPCGIVLLDASGEVSQINAAAADLLGTPLLGQTWISVVQRAFAPREDDGHEISLHDGRRVRISLHALHPAPGELIVISDLTSTRDFEQARNQQQRLAEMGKMTAHVAHQIRTPLSSGMLYLEHLTNPTLSESRKLEFIQEIKRCHRNIEQQLRDMLLFANGGASSLQTMSLAEFANSIEASSKVLLIQQGVTLSIQSKQSLFFQSYYESLQGAMHNLINNAVEANATAITITIALTSLDQVDFIEFTVKDNGSGMDEATQQQALQPFFTTKASGTGLGLAVVHAVVQAHGGHISITSQAAAGTEIKMFIPWLKQQREAL